MTRDQLHNAFKIELDKNATNISFGSYPAFLPEEIDYWLNQGMYQLVSNKFTGLNTLQESFEQSVKRVHDLERLIKTQTAITADKVDGTNKCIVKDAFKDKMFYVDIVFNFDNNSSIVDVVDHEIAKRFLKTYNNTPWIEIPVATIQDLDLIIYYDPISMNANKYSVDITYVKIPTKVENVTGNMDEFPEYLQYEMVSRAVLLALENIESQRVQTKSQLNQISE